MFILNGKLFGLKRECFLFCIVCIMFECVHSSLGVFTRLAGSASGWNACVATSKSRPLTFAACCIGQTRIWGAGCGTRDDDSASHRDVAWIFSVSAVLSVFKQMRCFLSDFKYQFFNLVSTKKSSTLTGKLCTIAICYLLSNKHKSCWHTLDSRSER